jgi:dihydrolipoamide dehydrogenase
MLPPKTIPLQNIVQTYYNCYCPFSWIAKFTSRWKVIGYRKAMTLATQPKSMIIVGSGAIGVEFAHSTFHGNWSNHCRIYAKYSSVEDEDISKQMERSLKSRNQNHDKPVCWENWYLSRCKSICENGKRRRSSAEILLSAVGIKTNIEHWIRRSRNRLIKDKILVNAYNQTNIPGYYAIMIRQDKR